MGTDGRLGCQRCKKLGTDEEVTCVICITGKGRHKKGRPPPSCRNSRCLGHPKYGEERVEPDQPEEDKPDPASVEIAPGARSATEEVAQTPLAEANQDAEMEIGERPFTSPTFEISLDSAGPGLAPQAGVAYKRHSEVEDKHVPVRARMVAWKVQ